MCPTVLQLMSLRWALCVYCKVYNLQNRAPATTLFSIHPPRGPFAYERVICHRPLCLHLQSTLKTRATWTDRQAANPKLRNQKVNHPENSQPTTLRCDGRVGMCFTISRPIQCTQQKKVTHHTKWPFSIGKDEMFSFWQPPPPHRATNGPELTSLPSWRCSHASNNKGCLRKPSN